MSPIPPPQARGAADALSRSNNFGMLRLVLAFLVLLAHSSYLVDGDRSREVLDRVFHTLSFGDLAVDCFFVISGYLITASHLGSSSGLEYLAKRILRIYPGFAVAYLFSLFVIGPLVGAAVDVASPGLTLRIVKGLVLLGIPLAPEGAMWRNHPLLLNGSLWTIRYEFGAYLAVLVFGWAGLLKKRHVVLSVAVGLFLAGLLLTSWDPQDMPSDIRNRLEGLSFALRFYGLFAAGAVFFLFRDKVEFRGRWAVGAGIGWVVLMFSNHTAHAAIATLGAYLLFYAALSDRWPLLARIGRKNDLSYGVYLYGWPLQLAIISWIPAVSPWGLFVLASGAAAAVACLSWVLIERPAIRLKQRVLAPHESLRRDPS